MNNRKYRILISGGGTGGHIFPALAIAGELRRRHPDCEILFVGAENRMEMERVPAAGYKIIGLPVAGFNRKNMVKNVVVVGKLLKSMMKARKILRDFNPDIAIGVGGYASGPMLKAAQKKGIPTLIQEQNSYAGVTNKLLAKGAKAICVAYDEMERFFPKEKITVTGNPVRKNLLSTNISAEDARAHFGLSPKINTILIIGGSLGARTINTSILSHLDRIAGAPIQILWQCGKRYAEECQKQLNAHRMRNIVLQPFIADMDIAYRAATLVVSRAGASSISELQLLGKPSILIPSPNVAEDHQTKNALALKNHGAALMIPDAEANEKLVETMITTAANPMLLDSLSQNVAKMALADADSKIVDKVEQIIASH